MNGLVVQIQMEYKYSSRRTVVCTIDTRRASARPVNESIQQVVMEFISNHAKVVHRFNL